MTRFFCNLAADRGQKAIPSTLLHDILCCNGSDSADLVQASKDECRHREGQVDDWDTSMVVLEASCFPVSCSLLAICPPRLSRIVNTDHFFQAIMPHSEEPTNGDATNGAKPTRRGVYLLTHPRSASNLFQTMMAKQRSHGADVRSSSYHFFNAAFSMFMQMGRGSLQGSNWNDADRAALYEPYKAAFEGLNGELASAEQKVC